MEPEIELLIAVAEQMPMHGHIAELVERVKARAKAREIVERGVTPADAPVADVETSGVERVDGAAGAEPTGEIDETPPTPGADIA